MEKRASLKEFIEAPEILVMPGAHDGMSAKIAAALGFKALICTDFGCSAIVLGKPDYGLISVSEMAHQIRTVSGVSGLPVLGDGGCGFGNPLNVYRAVQEYELAGASGMTLEDQVYPKRCGHMEGKQVIGREEMVKKLKAALKARSGSGFIICARTDSIATHGLEEAIARANAYGEAGADMVWADAMPSKEAIEEFVKRVGKPVMVAFVEGGRTPTVTVKELEAMGVAVVTFGLSSIFSSAKATWEVLSLIREEGSTARYLERMMAFEEFSELVGLKEMREQEREFGSG
ncbi:MAG: oxaloacetate decarboxylase [Nitrospinota bacterium]